MSFVEPIGFHCPACGKSRPNPNATLQDERGNFRSIVNCSAPKHCNDCKPLLRDHPFPDPAPTHAELRNRVRTIVGMPAPEHLPAEAADTEVVDDPDGRRR